MVIEDSVALTCIFLFWPLVLIDSRFQLASYDKSNPSKIKRQIHDVALSFLIIANYGKKEVKCGLYFNDVFAATRRFFSVSARTN